MDPLLITAIVATCALFIGYFVRSMFGGKQITLADLKSLKDDLKDAVAWVSEHKEEISRDIDLVKRSVADVKALVKPAGTAQSTAKK